MKIYPWNLTAGHWNSWHVSWWEHCISKWLIVALHPSCQRRSFPTRICQGVVESVNQFLFSMRESRDSSAQIALSPPASLNSFCTTGHLSIMSTDISDIVKNLADHPISLVRISIVTSNRYLQMLRPVYSWFDSAYGRISTTANFMSSQYPDLPY